MTRYFFYATALYSLFVIYGSLVPLDFRELPLNDALTQFKNIRYLHLGIGSLADWVANILLMIPLAFLWFTLLSKDTRLSTKFFLFIFIWLACFSLALVIEFTQLFFPPRTVSINDIIAESLGAFIGCMTGWFFGRRFMEWLQHWHQGTENNAWDRYLPIYLFGLFSYAVLPLDLTLSPVELYHKWHEERIILLPFSSIKSGFIENIYQWGSDAALWIPVPLLWQRAQRLTRFQIYQRIFLAALAIESFQLFVYSRVTDITDILLALLGGSIGIALTTCFSDDKPTQTRFKTGLSQSHWLGILFCVLWSFLLMAVFWYPFNFDINTALLAERTHSFFKIPFYSYYYGTEFRAITEVFHKTLFFIPLGIALACISWSYRFNAVSRFIAYFWIALTALGIEAIQIILPKKNADLTDWVLEFTGGVIGYVIAKQLLINPHTQKSTDQSYQPSITTIPNTDKDCGFPPRSSEQNWDEGFQKSATRDRPQQSHLYAVTKPETAVNFSKNNVSQTINHQVSTIKTPKIQLWLLLVLSVGLLALTLFFLSKLLFIPYNVRELISGQYAWLNCLGLSATFFWCLGFPVWFLAKTLTSQRENLWYCWTGVGIHSVVAWALIRLSAPLESIHDIVGSPILTNIPVELELFLRLNAFIGIFSLLLFGAVMMVNSLSGYYHRLFKYYITGFFSFIILLPIYYWGVVLEASTDNITELLPDEGRSCWVALIALYIFLSGFIGSACSALLALKQGYKLIWILLAGVISYPLGYLLMQWGTEQFIMKYGVVFSALQFLFSTDRNHYIVDEVLKLRFYFAHTAFISMIIITQYPQWFVIYQQQKSK